MIDKKTIGSGMLIGLLLVMFVYAANTVGNTTYYSFDSNNITGTNVYDRTGSNNNGTIDSAAQAGNGIIGDALLFTAGDRLTGGSMETSNFTVSLWFNTTYSIGEMLLVDDSGTGYEYFRFKNAVGNIENPFLTGTPATALEYDDGAWHHYVEIYNDDTNIRELYIDNVRVINGSNDMAPTGTWIFGERQDGGQDYVGDIDELSIWDRVITVAEIEELYNSGAGDAYPYLNANFSIRWLDPFTGQYLTNFSALVNGSNYNSGTSTLIYTPYMKSDGRVMDITLSKTNFTNGIYWSYNTTTNLGRNATYYASRHLINASVAPLNTTKINNFTVTTDEGYSRSTTNGSLVVPTTWNTSTVVYLDSSNYAMANWTTTGLTNDAHQFGVRTSNSFDLSFYDELTSDLIDYEAVTLEAISTSYSTNKTTTNGTIYIDLLTPADYVLRYSAPSYATREYYVTLTNNTYNKISLYLLNETGTNNLNVTATVKTSLNVKLDGAEITVTKYDIATNTYRSVQTAKTNFEGVAKLQLTTDELYKFIIRYNDVIVLSTSQTYIYEDTITFVVNIDEDPTKDFFNVLGIDFTLAWNNVSQEFEYTYSDGSSVISQSCLRVYEARILGDTLLNSSCLTSTTGSINLGISGIENKTYLAKASVTIDGEEYILGTIYKTLGIDNRYTSTGLFIIIFLTIAFAMIGIYSAPIALLLTPIPLLFGAIMKIIAISVPVAIGVYMGFIVLAALVGGKK